MGEISWIWMVVVGGVAGVIANRIMGNSHGLTGKVRLGNVRLGILGALGMKLILGNNLDSSLGQIVVAVMGAVAAIGVFQFIKNETHLGNFERDR